jgi:hypothetical protein
MKKSAVALLFLLLCSGGLQAAQSILSETIPLAEHPRPDFERREWVNLNGPWSFRFDRENSGERSNWQRNTNGFDKSIIVPFPWGSALSQVANEADIGWYARKIRIPENWKGRRVFLVVGASDWVTSGWLDGKPVGRHQGGYTPFEFELTKVARPGQEQEIVLRVDDTAHTFKLEGKQGYGQARGIWQTVYLEARPENYLRSLRLTPDIDAGKVSVKAVLNKTSEASAAIRLRFLTGEVAEASASIAKGQSEVDFEVAIPRARLWSLSDPFLYEVEASLLGSEPEDRVKTYFGMRKISVVKLPGSGYPYIALNNQPVYLQLALDQAYHEEGFYTYESDQFMREEILRARQIGLNGLRLHVKIDIPRKLYWADRLGILIMADVPNSWGEPDEQMRAETEVALRGMIERDYNHPSIFSWVVFNETWGLKTKSQGFAPETQDWVESMYRLAKSLDPTRLVEDNSPCNYDHVATDINTWHQYLPGYRWRNHLEEVVRNTFPGSEWNFIGGRKQSEQPLLNSECGNVWGYEGSTGDVDWSWDYHIMMNEFRRQPKICGWLYTEFHDVINEWNGYYRFDRSAKETGLAELVPGMSLRDLHSPYYIVPDIPLGTVVKPGASLTVPLVASFMIAGLPGTQLSLRTELYGWDDLGRPLWLDRSSRSVEFKPWTTEVLAPLQLTMPEQKALLVLALSLEDGSGSVLQRNFTIVLVTAGHRLEDETRVNNGKTERIIRIDPAGFSEAKWSLKQWNVLDGLKVNGAGSGYFEYRVRWPEKLDPTKLESVVFRAEVSAKQLFGKDREDAGKQEGDFMRGKGTHDPSLNRNAYPMTDQATFPSAVRLRVGERALAVYELPDDPADHRGALSWIHQVQDKYLREAGSYGYIISAGLTLDLLEEAAERGELVIRLEVDEALPGGLAIYGERFGRFPMDPSLVFTLKSLSPR